MDDDVLSLPMQAYSGNQIKINGYYYLGNSNSIYDSYFFYNNGILISGGGSPAKTASFVFIEGQFISPSYLKALKKDKSSWGLFLIDGGTIRFERWFCAEGFCKSYVREGKILNDTTFIVTQSYRMRNGQKTEIGMKNETYRFRPFGPKPDSSNVFIP